MTKALCKQVEEAQKYCFDIWISLLFFSLFGWGFLCEFSVFLDGVFEFLFDFLFSINFSFVVLFTIQTSSSTKIKGHFILCSAFPISQWVCFCCFFLLYLAYLFVEKNIRENKQHSSFAFFACFFLFSLFWVCVFLSVVLRRRTTVELICLFIKLLGSFYNWWRMSA